MAKAIITTGLQYGDEGKGSLVAALTKEQKAELVVRFSGGANCAHNVVTDEGIHHTFAQFGSGTFFGAKTLLSKYVLINPLNMLNEATALKEKGVTDPFDLVSIADQALVITPFHQVSNRLKEIARGKDRHGSCGQGIAATANYAKLHPFEAIRLRDLNFSNLKNKLSKLREFVLREIKKFKLDESSELVEKQLTYLNFDLTDLVNTYNDFFHLVAVLDEDQVCKLINKPDVVIFENAQGVLLDEVWGFHPHVTRSVTTTGNTLKILKDANYTGQVERIGLMRTFTTRHGHGPFPTEDPSLAPLIKDDHNKENDWQGNFRAGYLDIPSLMYALQVNPVDSLAVSHADLLRLADQWKICVGYKNEDGAPFELKKPEFTTIENQKKLTEQLKKIKCNYQHIPSHSVLHFIEKLFKFPIKVTSYGQRPKDKVWIDTP